MKSKTPIPKGALRCGSLVPEAGTYGRWALLKHWRVPFALKPVLDATTIEDGLRAVDEVVVSGVASLPPDVLQLLVKHLEVEENWASEPKTKKFSVVAARASEAVAVAKEPAAAADVATIVPATDKPIDEGLPPPAGQLAGKTFVISGVFDNISGPKSANFCSINRPFIEETQVTE